MFHSLAKALAQNVINSNTQCSDCRAQILHKEFTTSSLIQFKMVQP